MEYRKLDKLGVSLSLLGFGCMRLPTRQDGKIDRDEATRLIDKAYKNGVNYYDTAYTYHNSESEPFIGSALSAYDRGSFYIATKLPSWEVNSLADAERIFAEQQGRLQVSYVDFYLLHALSKKRWDKMVELGILEFVDKLKKEGKIKYLGFSFHDDYPVFEEILNSRDWDFCQIQLNYMDVDEQAGMKGYDLATAKGVPVFVMEPIKGGLLAQLPEEISSEFHCIAPERSMASWAFRWVASLPNVKLILSGMSTMEQVEDNLETFSEKNVFSPEEEKAVLDTADALRNRVYNGCTGCSYCMPCPHGVDIPTNFSIWNNYGIYRNINTTRWEIGSSLSEGERASNCTECGLCESSCPQKIEIRQDLKRVHIDFEKITAKE